MVYQALSMTDSAEAHEALVSGLSNAALPPDLRAQAAAALASAVRGSREAFDALEAAHHDATQAGETVFGASAGLAMGTQAGQIADESDRAAAFERLRANLTAADIDESRALWLASLGNTGDPDLFTQLEPFLASASPMVRASALFALRACNDPRTDGAIATAFASDPDETVRVTAARTLGYRDVVRFSPLLDQALRSDPSAVVRGEVLTLADATPTLAALLRPALEYVVRVDASARLRERAAALIASSSSALPGSP
jgi:HEAT repeat protein